MTEGPDLCTLCGHERGLHAMDYGPCTVPACHCGAFAEPDTVRSTTFFNKFGG